MKSPKDMRIIQIDITNACMYQCSNCTRFCGHHKKNFFMDFETFKRAVDSMEGYHGTIGVMGGEPTLHPEFERFVNYLHSKIPNEYKKDHRALVAPQKDFIESVFMDNKVNSEVYEYATGERETVVGAGLWSAMVPTYKKYYELIQDTFKIQAVNDHGNVMYHSPILINRKDLEIPDEEWIKIRDNCWAQEVWSATITPKGAFFCEIAAALDMLFDGPGGWPIEKDWWKRTPDQFGDQLKWCELCGIAIETFTRDANDWIDDISDSMYEKLLEIGSPKLKKPERINRVKIENGVIAEESKRGAMEIRKELFYDSFMSRFNDERTILFPDKFSVIVDMGEGAKVSDVSSWIEKHKTFFDNIYLLCDGDEMEPALSEEEKSANVVMIKATNKWGNGFSAALRKSPDLNPIIYVQGLKDFNLEVLAEFKESVINPGTMHVSDLTKQKSDVVLSEDGQGMIGLFHKEALALRKVGFDYITNAQSFKDLLDIWDESKVIEFDSSVIEDTSCLRIQANKRYAVYGAGITGRGALSAIQKINSEVVLYSDSDEGKWGENIEGIEVVSPQELFSRRTEYDKVVIASTHYKAIKQTLESLGFAEEDYIIHE